MPNNTLEVTLTTTTCGAACWFAREDACHCSCGGVNHGVLLQAGAEQPERQSKIQGIGYRLVLVGDYATVRKYVWEETKKIRALSRDDAPKLVYTRRFGSPFERVDAFENEPKARWWVKKATDAQIEKWPELTAAKQWEGRSNSPLRPSYLVWERVQTAEEINSSAAA